jgi:hypothetical protein
LVSLNFRGTHFINKIDFDLPIKINSFKMTQSEFIDVSQVLDLIKIQIKYIQTYIYTESIEEMQISYSKLSKFKGDLHAIIRMNISKHNMDTAIDYLDMILNIFDTQE